MIKRPVPGRKYRIAPAAEWQEGQGGAIAHGHPIGVTGAVLTTRLLYSMQRDRVKRGSSRFASAEGKASRSLLKQSIEVRRMPG